MTKQNEITNPKVMIAAHQLFGAMAVIVALEKHDTKAPGYALAMALARVEEQELKAELSAQILREAVAQGIDIVTASRIGSKWEGGKLYIDVDEEDQSELNLPPGK